MNAYVEGLIAGYRAICRKAHVNFMCTVERHGTLVMFALGFALLSLGLTELSLAQGRPPRLDVQGGYDATAIRGSVEVLFQLIEGSFGALIMVVSGIGAIIAAAFGAYRAAVGMLVVAVGAFILRALVSLFFGTYSEADRAASGLPPTIPPSN